jgi:outer membrane protein, heavy metal efflux system
VLYALALSLLAASATGPGPTSRPLTLAEAVEESRANGFDVLAAEAGVGQAQGDLKAAAALPNPILTVGAGPSLGCYGPGCRAGSPTLTGQLSEGGALWQVLVGKQGLKREVAQAALRAAQASRDDARRLLEALVRQQFVATVVAERALTFATEVRDSNLKTAELMRQRYQAGAVDDADVARVETQGLESEQAYDAAAQGLEQERSVLAFLLGRRGGTAALVLDPDGWLDPAPLPALATATVPELVERALANRPDVRALEAAVAQAEGSLRSVERSRVPDVALSVSYAQQGLSPDYSSPPNLSFGLSVPLPLVYRLDGEVTRAEATVRQARVQLEKGRALARSDVESAFAAYQASASQAQRMKLGLLQSAARARALVSVQYDKGAASLIEFLDAQRTFVAINVESLTVVQAFWSAVFRLEAALGQELVP